MNNDELIKLMCAHIRLMRYELNMHDLKIEMLEHPDRNYKNRLAFLHQGVFKWQQKIKDLQTSTDYL